MSNLTKIIKKDFVEVGHLLRGAVKGAVQGVYTPALMNTGIRQFVSELYRDDKSNAEIVVKNVAQVLSSCAIYVPLIANATYDGKGLECFGALALTNTVDYLVHAYKRSKRSKK